VLALFNQVAEVVKQVQTLSERVISADTYAKSLVKEIEQLRAVNHHHMQLAEARARQIQAIYQSHSWRITTPLRWCGHQVRLLRQHGLALRLKALLKKIGRFLIKCVIAFLSSHPGLRHRCVAVAQRFGIYNYLRSFYFRCYGQQDPMNSPSVLGQSAVSNATLDQLSPRARQIYADLKAAIEHHRKETR